MWKKDKQQQKDDNQKLYSTAQEFLDQVTMKMDTGYALYECCDNYIYQTSNMEDEYVVVVLKLKDHDLRQFYDGYYIVQQWTKKRKLFQAVHKAKPNNFFLYKQRFMYSMQEVSEESQWLYIVNFHQEIYNKIKNPLYDPKSKSGKHELQLFVDSSVMVVASLNKIMWAPFSQDEEPKGGSVLLRSLAGSKQGIKSANDSFSNDLMTMENAQKKVGEAKKKKKFELVEIQSVFKNVFASVDGEIPEFVQILDIDSEGFLQKELHVLMECETKIIVYSLVRKVLRKFSLFKFEEKVRFDKTAIGLGFRESLQTVTIVNISDTESYYLMVKGNGELKLLTNKNAERKDYDIRRLSKVIKENEEEYEDEDNFSQDAVIKLKSFFVRRQNIYLEEMNGMMKRLNIADCKMQKPLKRAQKIEENKITAMLMDISIHLSFYSDYIVANNAIMISHGKILSIYNFERMAWSHITPDKMGLIQATQEQVTEVQQTDEFMKNSYGTEEDLDKDEKVPQAYINKQSYFGVPDDEFQQLYLNHIYENSIFDFLIQYKSTQIRRMKYFSECQKTCFEKNYIFSGDKVRQIVKNCDALAYRQSGDIIERTFFLIQNSGAKYQELWVSENGSKMTKLIRNIQMKLFIVNLQNSSSDLIVIFWPAKKTLSFYSIPHIRQCLDVEELDRFKINEIPNWHFNENSKNYFVFGHKIFYMEEGNLMYYNLKKKGKHNPKKEFNFKSAIRDFYMTDSHTVYYLDKNNSFKFADIEIQEKFDITKLPTKIIDCKGAFITKLDFCFTSNRFSIFSSPIEVSIIPVVNNYSFDLNSTLNFEKNFVFYKQIGNKMFAFKQPNTVVSWDLDTGKVINNSEQDIWLKGFKQHSQWNGRILLRLIRDANNAGTIDEDYPLKSREYEEEKKAREQYPTKHLFSLVDIDEEGQIHEVCRFLYECKMTQTLYVSYPYVLAMDDSCAKFYSLESKDMKFKVLKTVNSYYEPMMKVGKPTYFSPDFLHRIVVDSDENELVINYSLNNTNLCVLKKLKKNIFWQANETNPMIYFHDNDKIVYVTVTGIEKVCQLDKIMKKKKTFFEPREISNIFYSEQDMVRRIIFDQFMYKKDLGSKLQQQHMLQIRSVIIKRGLLLNHYVHEMPPEEERKPIQREYPDQNIGNFNYFVVNNFRRELNFSYMSWKIIEQIKQKKLSIASLKKSFVSKLVFTLLPNMESILFYLINNFEELNNLLAIIMEEHHPSLQVSKAMEHVTLDINDVPFLPNLKGQTPLHKSIKENNTRYTDRIITAFANTELDHHSRFIMDKMYKLIDQIPSSFLLYLDSRQRTTTWVQNFNRGKIQAQDDCQFASISNQMWDIGIKKSIAERMFHEEEQEVPMYMYVVDLPNLQTYKKKESFKFMRALSLTDNIEIFQSVSTRAIIETKWPLVKKAMIKYLFYPYLVMLVSFIIYAVIIFERLQEYSFDDDGESTGWDVTSKEFWIKNQKQLFKISILTLSGYFFLLAFRGFVAQGPAKYLTNPWRYIDIIPLSLMVFSLLFEYITSDYPKVERALNSVATFLLWIKFLYFLRMFRSSSKFISMIVAIFGDMKIFMGVFAISLMSFSQSLYILSNNNSEEDKFIANIFDSLLFTYNIALGSWDTGNLGQRDTLIVMALFILSTIFLCIIMLNLIIAVISDTYARVEGTSQNVLYKNFADLIIENEFLIPGGDIQHHDDQGSYLYLAKMDESEAMVDVIESQITQIKETITQRSAVLDRVAIELSKTSIDLLNQSSQKFVACMNEEAFKSESSFKYLLNALDHIKHNGDLLLQPEMTALPSLRYSTSIPHGSPEPPPQKLSGRRYKPK